MNQNTPSIGNCKQCGEFAVNGIHSCPPLETATLETLIDRHGKEWTVRLRRPDGSVYTLSRGGWYEGQGESDKNWQASVGKPMQAAAERIERLYKAGKVYKAEAAG